MKIAIAGTGKIAPIFLNAAKLLNDIEVTAICGSTNFAKMKELSEKYHIEGRYMDYDIMLNETDGDTIYVAVPNHLHYEFARKAIEKGKHVILEKPFTVHLEEAEELFELARQHHVYVFEAITTIHSPDFKKMKELICNFDKIRIAYFNYTQYSSRYDDFKKGIIHAVFDKHKYGGALRDLNVYNLHLAIGLFGKPVKVTYYPNMENGIDVSGTVILEYDSFTCVCIGSKDCLDHAEIRIQGDKKMILSMHGANMLGDFQYMDHPHVEKISLIENNERLYYEIKEFARVVKEKDDLAYEAYKNHTLLVMEAIEQCLKVQ